jgi:hypothetical protein
VSIADSIRLAALEAEVAALLARTEALETGQCPTCAARRAGNAARQQRHRSRERDCSPEMP